MRRVKFFLEEKTVARGGTIGRCIRSDRAHRASMHSVNAPPDTPRRRRAQSPADELRARLLLAETREPVVLRMLGIYRETRDWRRVAETLGIAHRTMSRFLALYPEIGEQAEAIRATWSSPNGLAGFNAARASACAWGHE